MNDDPLLPYLAEIVTQPEADGILLTGGFGMRLKQYHLLQRREAEGRQVTLIADLPEARATQDLDLMLGVRLWVERDRARALSAALKDRLGYETVTHSWQLRKPLTGVENRFVRLDLLARSPLPDEPVNVRDRPRQVGRGMGTGISGRETPEAFAVDDSPLSLAVPYRHETDGDGDYPKVLVPHPYAWFQLKIRAAYDWLREQRGEVEPKVTRDGDRIRLKHVYDVYVLAAMLTREERDEAALLAKRYAEHQEARKTREQAAELYGSAAAPGFAAIRAYGRRSARPDVAPDFDLFWEEGLRFALSP